METFCVSVSVQAHVSMGLHVHKSVRLQQGVATLHIKKIMCACACACEYGPACAQERVASGRGCKCALMRVQAQCGIPSVIKKKEGPANVH